MADLPDDDFFEALAGRAPAGLPEHEKQRIELLRAVLHAREGGGEAPAAAKQAGLDRLMFRLRREGLLEKPRSRMPYAVAALVVAGAGLFALDLASWLRGTTEAPPIMRGDGRVQVIEADDVDARVAAITRALESRGIEATTYPLGINQGLNASIPPDKRGAVAAILKPLGVDLPASGELRLEVRRKQ